LKRITQKERGKGKEEEEVLDKDSKPLND